MKSKYSSSWSASKQPRKQRKYRANAPLHRRQKLVSAHLSKELRTKYGKRSVQLRKEDEVIVITGEFKGKKGKIEKVSLKKLKVFVEGIKRKKPSGQEVPVQFDPSNVMVVSIKSEDKKRDASLRRKMKNV